MRRTDVLRGEIESDRLNRLLALRRGLDTLRLLDKDERRLIMTSFRNQMSTLEDQLVSGDYPDRLSSTAHTRRFLPDAEPSLAERETAWLDEVDLDELYHEDGLSVSVTTGVITPEEIDAVCVAFLVASRENKHRPLGFAASTVLELMIRTLTTLGSHCFLSECSIKARVNTISLTISLPQI